MWFIRLILNHFDLDFFKFVRKLNIPNINIMRESGQFKLDHKVPNKFILQQMCLCVCLYLHHMWASSREYERMCMNLSTAS